MRQANIERKTSETDIKLSLTVDGRGQSEIASGCPFLDHMLTLLAKHGKFDLTLSCKGDTDIDYHHTVEDIGICLGRAFCEALGDKKGIRRYGSTLMPMDESLILSAVDVSGRSYLSYGLNIPAEKVGDFDTELTEEFFLAFTRNAGMTLHIKQLDGKNSHHIIEGAFKSVAHSLRTAASVDCGFENDLPSTKGLL